MPEQKWSTRKLNITGCKETYRGQGANGEFVIYDVTATNEQGVLVNQKLSSFTQLPLGLGDYEVQPYYKNGELKNYTIRAPKGAAQAAQAQQINLLLEFKTWAEGRINGLETRVEELERRAMGGSVPPSTPVGKTTGSPVDPDDDIPFLNVDVQWEGRYEHGSRW